MGSAQGWGKGVVLVSWSVQGGSGGPPGPTERAWAAIKALAEEFGDGRALRRAGESLSAALADGADVRSSRGGKGMLEALAPDARIGGNPAAQARELIALGAPIPAGARERAILWAMAATEADVGLMEALEAAGVAPAEAEGPEAAEAFGGFAGLGGLAALERAPQAEQALDWLASRGLDLAARSRELGLCPVEATLRGWPSGRGALRALLRAGVEPDWAGSKGGGALAMAVSAGVAEAVEMLAAAGADPERAARTLSEEPRGEVRQPAGREACERRLEGLRLERAMGGAGAPGAGRGGGKPRI